MTSKLTLCGICKKPIHVDDLGSISKADGFLHVDCESTTELSVENKKRVEKQKERTQSCLNPEGLIAWGHDID